MDKIKRFIDCGVPSFACNLTCNYCYVAQNYLFTQKIPEFKYTPELVGKALSKKRMEGICMFNICASGETLLPKIVIDYTKAILEQGHYVMIVTNLLASKRLTEIAEFPEELRKRLFFKVSFHYLELKKRNLFNKFFANIDLIKQMGASFTLEITPCDELIPFIDEIKEMSMSHVGAWPHITVARDESIPDYPLLTEYSKEEYKKIWGVFDSKMFDFKISVFGEKRTEYCYAGNWSATLNLMTGTMKQCYSTNYFTNIYKNVDKPIRFVNMGKGCKAPHCHNAHAFLTFGSIPSIETPCYTDLRNRVCVDGTEWLNEEMKSFMSTKLKDSNEISYPSKDIYLNKMYNLAHNMWLFYRKYSKKINPSFKSYEQRKTK